MSTGLFYVTDISGQVPSQDKEVTDAGVEAYRKNCKNTVKLYPDGRNKVLSLR